MRPEKRGGQGYCAAAGAVTYADDCCLTSIRYCGNWVALAPFYGGAAPARRRNGHHLQRNDLLISAVRIAAPEERERCRIGDRGGGARGGLMSSDRGTAALGDWPARFIERPSANAPRRPGNRYRFVRCARPPARLQRVAVRWVEIILARIRRQTYVERQRPREMLFDVRIG